MEEEVFTHCNSKFSSHPNNTSHQISTCFEALGFTTYIQALTYIHFTKRRVGMIQVHFLPFLLAFVQN